MNPYEAHFRNVSDRRVVETMDAGTGTDPQAIEAAHAESARRGLDQETIDAIRAEIRAEKNGRARTQARVDRIVDRTGTAVHEAKDLFMHEPGTGRPDRRQRLILLFVLGLLWLPVLPRLRELAYVGEYGFDASMAEFFLPVLLLPLAMWLIWTKRKAGWFVGAVCTLYPASSVLWELFAYWNADPYAESYFLPIEIPTRSELVLRTIILGACASAFQMRRALALFSVKEGERWITIGGSLLSMWLMYRIYLA